MTSELERLRAEVLANPNSKDAALVLADALSEAGDAHGQLITLQVHEPGGAEETELREQFEREIVGPECDELAGDFEPLYTFEWRWGFVRRATTEIGSLALDHRAMQLTTELVTVLEQGDDTRLTRHSLPHLRTLQIEYSLEDTETLTSLYRCQSLVENLTLVLMLFPEEEMAVGDLHQLQQLRRFELECDDFGADNLERLINLELPRLERLAINSDLEELGELRPLLDSLPRPVTELGIFGYPDIVELVSAILSAPSFSRLSALGLDFSDLESPDSEAHTFLKGHRRELEKLKFFLSREGRTDADSMSGLGQLLSGCLGRHADGEEMILSATKLEPDYATHWLALARVRADRGDTDGAHEALDQVQHTDSDSYDEDDAEAIRAKLDPRLTRRLFRAAKRWLDD